MAGKQGLDVTISTADEIEKLASLLDRGLLTREEFDAKKATLLREAPIPAQVTTNAAATPPPRNAWDEQLGEKSGGMGCWGVGAILLGTTVALFVFFSWLGSQGNPSHSASNASAPPAWGPPEGFSQTITDNGVPIGYRWLKSKEYDCDYGDYCWGLEIVPSVDCSSSFYAQINILDKSGTVVDWTNDTAKVIQKDQRAKLVFRSFNKRARQAEIKETVCR